MLKITKTHDDSHHVVLELDGKITEQWAALLDGECRSLLRQKKSLAIDCSRVDFLDASGVEVLQHLPRARVTLVNPPGFVREMLLAASR
jgi:anti-anti-sigma regulatory factor